MSDVRRIFRSVLLFWRWLGGADGSVIGLNWPMMLLIRGMSESWARQKGYEMVFTGFRMNQTMERLKRMEEKDYTTLVRILFGLELPTPLPSNIEDPESGSGKVDFVNPTLNDSQKDAIRFALASREVALIHGPPGVGFRTRPERYLADR